MVDLCWLPPKHMSIEIPTSATRDIISICITEAASIIAVIATNTKLISLEEVKLHGNWNFAACDTPSSLFLPTEPCRENMHVSSSFLYGLRGCISNKHSKLALSLITPFEKVGVMGFRHTAVTDLPISKGSILFLS